MVRHINIELADRASPQLYLAQRRQFVDYDRHITLVLYVLDDGLVRVTYFHGVTIEDEPSYGVSAVYQPRPNRILREYEKNKSFYIETNTLKIEIESDSLRVHFYDVATGQSISRDLYGYSYENKEWTGDIKVWLSRFIDKEEHFYGLGDKPCELNLRGKKFELWGADHYDFHENSDPLYKNIPFFISMRESATYGLFFDNTSRAYFDFGSEKSHELRFGAVSGLMNYYFIYEKSAIEVIASYTRLTGLPSLPPLWSLGYQQSKWSYHPESQVYDVANKIRSSRVPCDVIYLDHHYMYHKENFTWNYEEFPNPKKMMKKLLTLGLKTVVILNPGVKVNSDSKVWCEGLEKRYFCRRGEGALLSANVWPGLCNFPDFTSVNVRRWWASLLKPLITNDGVRGFWLDMNEPVIFPDKTFPMDTRHYYDGMPCSHEKAHNIYGHCMVDATYTGMRVYAKPFRPFVLSRSGYAGLQRMAATWTGDNRASWEHLKLANHQCQRLACSGISFAGSDVGGFLDHPDGELMCRWMQLASFHLFFRNHSSGEYDQEPWVYDESVLSLIRTTIERRYKLLPYFYTQFYKYSLLGTPILRSLAIQCCKTVDTYWRSAEFFVGDYLYIAPILEQGAVGRFLYVPEGTWYSYLDDRLIEPQEEDVWVDCPLSAMPIYVRGGAIIPHWPVQQYVGEITKPNLTLSLWWAPNDEIYSDLYEDAGDGYEYISGQFVYHQWHYISASEQGFELIWKQNGEGSCFHDQLNMEIHGIPSKVKEIHCQLDGEPSKLIRRKDNIFLLEEIEEFDHLFVWW